MSLWARCVVESPHWTRWTFFGVRNAAMILASAFGNELEHLPLRCALYGRDGIDHQTVPHHADFRALSPLFLATDTDGNGPTI